MDAGAIAFEVMDDLRACLCTALADSAGGATCFCGVYPGQQATADWCNCSKSVRGTATSTSCGMAWVRLVSVYPYDAFPSQAQKAPCSSPLAAVIEMGVFRCLPGLDAQGKPPGAVAQAEAVLTQTGDLSAMHAALTCCTSLTERDHVLGRYNPVSGGVCGGGTWQATVALRRVP